MNRFLLGIILFFLCFQLFSFLFLNISHDWDLDSFVYLGSRLVNHHELLFTHDFETKFPLVQYLFAFAYLFGGVGVWKIMTLLFSIFVAFLVPGMLIRTPKESVRLSLFKKETFEYALFYLLIMYSLPGGETFHLEVVSASLLYLFLAIWYINLKDAKYLQLFVAGILLVLAALIRPNYLYLIPVFSLSFFLLKTEFKCKIIAIIVFGIGLVIPIICVFLPYFFIENGVKQLSEGLGLIIRFDQSPIGWKTLILHNLFNTFQLLFFFGIYFFSLAYLHYTIYRKKIVFSSNHNIVAGILPICSLFILYSFSKTHFYFHYVILFLPFFLFVIYLLRSEIDRFKKYTNRFLFVQVLVVFTLPLYVSGKIIVKKQFDLRKFNWHLNSINLNPNLFQYLKLQKEPGKTFLVLDNPVYHTFLDESRIGDGHPFLLNEFLIGKMNGPVGNCYFLNQSENQTPCEVLKLSPKSIFVLSKDHFFFQNVPECLSDTSLFEIKNLPQLEGYLIWERKKN